VEQPVCKALRADGVKEWRGHSGEFGRNYAGRGVKEETRLPESESRRNAKPLRRNAKKFAYSLLAKRHRLVGGHENLNRPLPAFYRLASAS
jgi:hypothetical protein